MTFAKLKALLRKAAARTRNALWGSIDASQPPSLPKIAPITSGTRDMHRFERRMLQLVQLPHNRS